MTNGSKLTLWFEGGDNFAQFSAMVSAQGFSGETSYILYATQVRSFLQKLTVFPLTEPALLTVGEEFDDGPLLQLEVRPVDRIGNLQVRVMLSADDDRNRRVETDFLCVYSDLERFAGDVVICLQSGGEATLAPAS